MAYVLGEWRCKSEDKAVYPNGTPEQVMAEISETLERCKCCRDGRPLG